MLDTVTQTTTDPPSTTTTEKLVPIVEHAAFVLVWRDGAAQREVIEITGEGPLDIRGESSDLATRVWRQQGGFAAHPIREGVNEGERIRAYALVWLAYTTGYLDPHPEGQRALDIVSALRA